MLLLSREQARDFDAKQRTPSRTTLHPDRPVVLGNDPLRDGQPEPDPALGAAAGSIYAVEAFEDLALFFAWNAGD